MSIEVSWYIPDRVLMLRSAGVPDAAEADKKLTQALGESKRAVHLLMDGSLVEQLPGFAVLKRWQWPRQSNLGYTIIYGMQDKTLQMVIRLAAKFSGARFHFCNTLEDSAGMLQKLDVTLPGTITEAGKDESLPTRQVETPGLMKIMQAQLFKVSEKRCEYCRVPMPHAVDLLVARIEPNDEPRFDNLCLVCIHCKKFRQRRKFVDPLTSQEVPLFHPRKDRWYEHFAWSMDNLQMVGITPIGRATIAALRLHIRYHIQLRQKGIEEGWHPPRKPATRQLRSDFFPDAGRVRLEIQNVFSGKVESLTLTPPFTLGRSPEGSQPVIDLEPYGGYGQGVSRTHVRINSPVKNALMLTDLDSTNGTFINQERLSPEKAHRLRHGDEMRLGKLVIHVYFESNPLK